MEFGSTTISTWALTTGAEPRENRTTEVKRSSHLCFWISICCLTSFQILGGQEIYSSVNGSF
ncbi:MAG: hypothetical protein AMJ41_00785 [candidate division Zixibacteria bacterium DG_27]|nr:MAG: hypothetical protein AMJ41_00785 [candidate division Zixibacteria bacterium DG_27]